MLSVLVFTTVFVSVRSSSWPPVTNAIETSNITQVYVVSSCHLDVGFANTAANIVNLYFDKYFPQAIQVSQELRDAGEAPRLVFTTHAYLVQLYLSCPPGMGLHCPSSSSVQAFREAVKRGDIVWHAYPFNAQPEVYDYTTAERGFQVSHKVQDNAGAGYLARTMSQRDVPGMTRALVPIMASNGIDAVSVGVNSASMPPAVPTAFVWRDNTTGAEVLGMWHPHGYGGSRGVELDSTVIVPGMPYALAYAIRGDNTGPPSANEVVNNFLTLNKLFPNAKITASGYDEFVKHLKDYKHLLPVVTEEIGDTWIHGVASDPWKTAQAREIMRLSHTCITTGGCQLDEDRFFNHSVLLLKYGEHTWGKDVKKFLHDLTHWENSDFREVQTNHNFVDMVNSWLEQRDWAINYTIEALNGLPLQQQIVDALRELYFNGDIDLNGYEPHSCDSFDVGGLHFEIEPVDSSIRSLKDSRGKNVREYSGNSFPLAKFVYETFTSDEYLEFLHEYIYDPALVFAFLDFGKPGLVSTMRAKVSPSVKSCWLRETSDPSSQTFLIESQFTNASLVTDYGAPARVWLEISVPKTEDPDVELKLNLTLYIVNKTTTRIPESLSLAFSPNSALVQPESMSISKLNSYIKALEVLKNGSQHVHASDEGVKYLSGVKLAVKAWDTALVAIGGTNVFPVPAIPPAVEQGFAFNIYNNIWGTNYIMWYPFVESDKSSKYRFTITLPPTT